MPLVSPFASAEAQSMREEESPASIERRKRRLYVLRHVYFPPAQHLSSMGSLPIRLTGPRHKTSVSASASNHILVPGIGIVMGRRAVRFSPIIRVRTLSS
jgi:hypothetical protein